MWPAAFSFSLIALILFWSGANSQQILSEGAIPAHIIFPFLLIHLFLYRIPVPLLGFLPTIVTGLLYIAVTGIYTLGNKGVGPYEPQSPIMNWQTGETASAIFIGLAIILVSHAFLYCASGWPLRVRGLPPPPPDARPLPPAAAQAPHAL
jgi:hypothetical protein